MRKSGFLECQYLSMKKHIFKLCLGISLGMCGLFALDFTHYANAKTIQLTQQEKLPEPALDEPELETKPKKDSAAPVVEAKDPPEKPQPTDEKASADEEVHPEIQRDLSALPFPVRRMRELILEAAISGEIEKLRQLIGYGDDVTMLSLGGIEEDPLGFLKSLSGDKEGHEILAILAEVLESGYVLMDEGTEQELYVWPYFFAWPLDRLSPAQKVELYRLVTYGDYEDMESFGAYIFYRVGITPRGRWRFFVAGD